MTRKGYTLINAEVLCFIKRNTRPYLEGPIDITCSLTSSNPSLLSLFTYKEDPVEAIYGTKSIFVCLLITSGLV